jgi:hypothetical protein
MWSFFDHIKLEWGIISFDFVRQAIASLHLPASSYSVAFR